MPKQLLAILTALFLATCFSGCSQPDVDNSNGDNPDASAQSNVNSSTAPKSDIATQPNTLPTNDATATEVCERFLGLLAQGERTLAEQLLTRQALKVTVAAGLQLEAMGGTGSSVEVGMASYATSRATVAQVPCTVSEKDGSTQTLTWMMRRGESGWRIAGLIVDSEKSPELLSLENKADVLAIMGSKSSPQASGDIRQVSGTDNE